MSEISREDYYLISHLVRGHSGLDLGEGKEYLVVSRLEPLLSNLGFSSLGDLFRSLRSATRNAELVRAVSEALATHESLFFRDTLPYQCLVNEMLPSLSRTARPSGKIRIWSAACSFGQEPYSILFAVDEKPQCLNGQSLEIIATDFSGFAISRAKEGTYSQFEVQRGLTSKQIQNFMDPVSNGWRVQSRIRNQVDFRELNFLDSFAPIGNVDIIFCRNVLIYFELEMKKKILERMRQVLAPDGYLVLGSTEAIFGVTDAFVSKDQSQCPVFIKRV